MLQCNMYISHINALPNQVPGSRLKLSGIILRLCPFSPSPGERQNWERSWDWAPWLLGFGRSHWPAILFETHIWAVSSSWLVFPDSSRPKEPPTAPLWICITGLARIHLRMSKGPRPCTSPSWTMRSGGTPCSTEKCRDMSLRPSKVISATALCE